MWVHIHINLIQRKELYSLLAGEILVGINHQIFAFPHPEQPCLFLYLKDEMLRRIDKLRDLDVMESKDHKAIRSIAAGSELLQWDTQGVFA